MKRYTKAMKKPSRKKQQEGVAPAELDLSYRHVAGTLP